MSNFYLEFDDFRLDPSKRILFRGDQLVSLTPRAFELLSTLVNSRGRTLSKECLIKAVWKGVFVDESNFHVTLHTVRRALGESGRAPNYIIKTVDGYSFTAPVKEISASDHSEALKTTAHDQAEEHDKDSKSQIIEPTFKTHIVHVLFCCTIYAALYSVAVLLELAYQFDRFGATSLRIAPLVFTGVLISSLCALILDYRYATSARTSGLVVSSAIFLISAALLFMVLVKVLPNHPITSSNLQSYPAQAAYLKDELYFLLLAILFMTIPFHFIMVLEKETHDTKRANDPRVAREITCRKVTYPKPWILGVLLVVFALVSVAMTAHLIDNLIPGPYMNLFVSLVYLRGILYFGLGLECLLWYWNALKDLHIVNPRITEPTN